MCSIFTGCKDAAGDLQIRVTALQSELIKSAREIETLQRELARRQEESSAKTSPQPAAPSVSAPLANSGISRQELDEALQSAFARFKSESTSIPTQPFAASLENPVTPSAVPPKSVANGGPGLPVAESHDVRWGSKKPAEPVPTATPPTQRAPVTPPRQSSNLPPAAQEVPIKF
jgi:hypothetical protein